MNETPIGSLRLSTLSEHDRFVAEAQMARAEAIADAFLALSRWIRKGWAGMRASVHAYNTRQWPHPQALR